MPQRILIPVDDSTTTERTTRAVIANRELLPAEIVLLHVVDVQLVQRLVPDLQKNMIYEAAEKSGIRILEKLAQPFIDAGFTPKLVLELGTPEEAIRKVVGQQNVQLVIIGRHEDGGGLLDLMFGSMANQLIRTLKCPVLLV
jgi:nucleotide-binding universal stress UspA family protein